DEARACQRDREPCPGQERTEPCGGQAADPPAIGGPAGSLAEPLIGYHVLLEGGIEVVHGRAQAKQLVGLNVVVVLAQRRQPSECELLRRADRTSAVPLTLRLDDG